MSTRSRIPGATIWQLTLLGLRYLNGRRLRTALTTLALVFGVALIFCINLVLPSALAAFKGSMSTMSGADIRVTMASGEAFSPDAVLPRLAAVEDVEAAAGVLRRQFSVPAVEGSKLTSEGQLIVIGVDPAQRV